ncbi:TPA: hypothetical protein ACULYY_002775, partial [Legionella pneumophila]
LLLSSSMPLRFSYRLILRCIRFSASTFPATLTDIDDVIDAEDAAKDEVAAPPLNRYSVASLMTSEAAAFEVTTLWVLWECAAASAISLSGVSFMNIVSNSLKMFRMLPYRLKNIIL